MTTISILLSLIGFLVFGAVVGAVIGVLLEPGKKRTNDPQLLLPDRYHE